VPKRRKKSKKVSKVSNQDCATKQCSNNAYYVNSLLCHACYQADRYWGLKSVTQRAKRKRQLSVFTSRLDVFE
jgi:hypothetical protein